CGTWFSVKLKMPSVKDYPVYENARTASPDHPRTPSEYARTEATIAARRVRLPRACFRTAKPLSVPAACGLYRAGCIERQFRAHAKNNRLRARRPCAAQCLWDRELRDAGCI